MKVAILGSTLRLPLSGIGKYTVHLVQELRRIAPESEFTVVRPPEPTYADLGAPSLEVPLDRGALRKFPETRWGLTTAPRRACQADVDIVHSPGTVGAFTRTPRRGPKKVLTVHDLSPIVLPDTHRLLIRLEFKYLAKRSMRHADGIIADSQHALSDVYSTCGPGLPQASAVVPLGVHARFFEPPGKAPLQEPYFLFVGNLEPRKNLARVLDAFRMHREAGGEEKLVLVGPPGWRNAAILSRLEHPSLRDAVVRPGFIAEADLPAWYAHARGLVYASLYEGFGLPILEAMAAGSPVVTSTVSSMPEVAGDAALYVDPTSTDELAVAMARLGEAATRTRLTRMGRERAALFTWERTARATLRFYASLLE